MQNKKKFGDEMVQVLHKSIFSYPDGVLIDLPAYLMHDTKRHSFMVYHYDAEENLAFTQVCPSIILFNSGHTKVATKIKNNQKTIITTMHLKDVCYQEDHKQYIKDNLNNYYNMKWAKDPKLVGLINRASLNPKGHLYLVYNGVGKHIKSINPEEEMAWYTFNDCKKFNADFDEISRLIIDEYFIRGDFYGPYQKTKRRVATVSA